MVTKDWFSNSGITAKASADQVFEGKHYFQSVCLYKEAFRAIVQTHVDGAVVSSNLIELRKSPSPALVEEILKLEAFEDMKQHIAPTTY